MTCNLEVIARMAMNGYLMIPAEPGQKQTYCKWGGVKRSNYNFSELFRGRPLDLNAAILCEDEVCVLDFDNHGPQPNGVTLYRKLVGTQPKLFKGCILELTQSGGYHVYYRGIKNSTYKVDFEAVGFEAYYKKDENLKPIDKISVEVLCGRRLVYCWPTVTEKGQYTLFMDRTFLNTRPGDLPELPEVFKRVDVEKPEIVNNVEPGELTRMDVDAAIEYYLNDCHFNGAGRHDQSRALARCLAGLGLQKIEITRHVEDFIKRHGRELTDKKEAERIADYGIKHPLDGTPWTAIMEARRQRGKKTLRMIIGED